MLIIVSTSISFYDYNFFMNRMGNLKKWGGPLSDDWFERQLLLGQKIIRRFISLGIIPVFPGFAGHVPDSLKRLLNADCS